MRGRPAPAAWLALAFLGCSVPAPVHVSDAEGSLAISAIAMTCSAPVALEQDCSSSTGAGLLIELDAARVRIAGTGDGRTFFVTGPDPNGDLLKGRHGQLTNVAYEVAKRRLVAAGIRIESVTPVESMGSLLGYLVATDGDAYALLKAHAAPAEGAR